MASTLQLTLNGNLKASAQSVIELPIRVTTDMQLTALSLILAIPDPARVSGRCLYE